MPKLKRIKTKYPGVVYVMGTSAINGDPERIYYIRYRRAGKLTEEKAGRQFQDDMTPARASQVRAERIRGHEASNQERREEKKAAELAEASKWTIDKLWKEYKSHKPDSKGLRTDDNRYENKLPKWETPYKRGKKS